MRTFWLFSGILLGLWIFQRPVVAQTMVEYGTASSAAATASGTMKGLGNSISGLLENLSKTLDQAKSNTATVHSEIPPASKPPAPAAKFEDAMGIQKGMSCDEVTRRFGPPAMAFAGEDNGKTMSYASKSGGIQVECQGGKVSSVVKPN